MVKFMNTNQSKDAVESLRLCFVLQTKSLQQGEGVLNAVVNFTAQRACKI